MANSPKEFRASLRRFGDKLTGVLTDIPKELAKSTRDRVAARTPILTGRASGSWNASVNTPDGEVKPEDYMNPTGAPTAGNVNVDDGKLGDTYHVSNAISYLPELNDGSSQKAPAGFVEMTAAEAPIVMPGIVAKVRARYGL